MAVQRNVNSPRIQANFRKILGTKHFRSKHTDGLDSTKARALFEKFGIKTIIDLRNEPYINDSDRTPKVCEVDQFYTKYTTSWKAGRLEHRLEDKQSCDDTQEARGAHYNIDIVTGSAKEAARGSWLTTVILILANLVGKILKFRWLKYQLLFCVIGRYLPQLYRHIVVHGARPILAALELLSEPCNVPSLVICAYGKDRTGIIAALVQACCGLDDHAIAKDYAKSEVELNDMMEQMTIDLKKHYLDSSFRESKYEWMIELLQFIRTKYGGISEYLESIGFTIEKQNALKRNVMQTD